MEGLPERSVASDGSPSKRALVSRFPWGADYEHGVPRHSPCQRSSPPWESRYGESGARLTDSQWRALPAAQFSRKDAAQTDAKDDRPPESPPCRDGTACPILSPMDRGWLGSSTSPRPVGVVREPSPPPGSAGSGLTRRVSDLRASGASSHPDDLPPKSSSVGCPASDLRSDTASPETGWYCLC